MMETTATFALLGAALGAAESMPYLRDTWRGSTVPHRGSWLIWSVIELVSVESQRADGAHWSLLPTRHPSVPLLMYPVYFALVNAAPTLVIARRRRVARTAETLELVADVPALVEALAARPSS